MSRILVFLIKIFLSVFTLSFCFNLSPLPNIVIRKPNLQTFKPQNRSSYFGFSLVLREKSLIIGAPRAQSTLPSQATIDETGDVFKCPLNLKRSNAETRPEIVCKPFIFETRGNTFNQLQTMKSEFRDHQWLGAAMDGSSNDSEPLLVCAPRINGGHKHPYDDIVGYMHGICYRSANSLEENAVNIWRINPFADPSQQIDRSVYNFQLAQLGISAHITPDNNEYIMGAPGFFNWLGTAVRLREPRFDYPMGFNQKSLVLTGYAVGSGYLSDSKRNFLIYVTTAPHAEGYYGKATVYYYTRYGINVLTTLIGEQYGAFYGYALVVSDINGDDLDDIIITAPQHRVKGEADIGAIYVYVNKGGFQFSQQIIEAPFKTTARFGTTISSLGDINHDGYNDIAVGAPFFNGKGAVVIYHGGSNGLQREPKQILKLPENLNSFANYYFGHGLSKGVDIDGNGYMDLAIGAPNGETVYIYRAYPVVKVTTSIKPSQESIKPETSSIDFEVCFQIDKKQPTALLLELEADSRLLRLKFQDNDSNQIAQTVLATNFKKCQKFAVNIIFVANQIFVPLEMELQFSLVNNGTQQETEQFCQNCAVVDPSTSRTQRSVIKYNPGCKTDVCKVDLSIQSIKMPTKIIIGEVKALKLTYEVQNHGEKAFNTQVTITNSLNLTLTRMPPQCFELIENELICDIAKGVKPLEKSDLLEIEYDLSNIGAAKKLYIQAAVTSTGNEIDNANNKIVDKIQFERQSVGSVKGGPMENLLPLYDFTKNRMVEFFFSLENSGPSDLQNFALILQTPVAFLDETQKPHHYVNMSEIKYSLDFGNQEITGAKFNLSSFNMNEGDDILAEKWLKLEALGISPNRTQMQTCQGTNSTLCAASVIQVDSLKKSADLRLRLRVNFNASVLRDFLKGEQNFLGYFVDVYFKLNETDGVSLLLTKTLQPVVIENRIDPERPFWIYLLAIVGGVLLFALLTYGLLKLGFFRRTKKEEMLLLKRESMPGHSNPAMQPSAPLGE